MNLTYNENATACTLQEEMKAYEAVRRLKADEHKLLVEWVADGNSVYRNPFYMYDDDGDLIDYISAYRRCVKKHKIELRRELKEYEAAIVNLSDKERSDLHEWVLAGNSVYNNPYLMADDSGGPIDYIRAVRITADMRENPELYGIQCGESYV